MRKLPITTFGTDAQGIRLYGNKYVQNEPPEVRIAFPGGDVTVARTTSGDYWVHVRTDAIDQTAADAIARPAVRITDARLDIAGKHTSEVDTGDFANPALYHLAVRVTQEV